jgi:integrase/recombinase XerD
MSNAGRKFHPQALTTAEVELLIAACPATPSGIRTKALVTVLWRTGLRCSEALQLRTWDVDPADHTVRVMFGKGRRARTVGMETRAFSVLDDWLRVRAGLGFGDSEPLFCTMAGRPLASRYVRAVVAELGRGAGIRKRVHPHGLRHTRAVEMRRGGKDVYLISRALGHSNVGTTDRYLSDLFPREVVDAMLDSDWGRAS